MSRKDTHHRLSVGDKFPQLKLTGITEESISIPDPSGVLTHLQFRRFAGCPICNLHLRSISGRLDEITAAGVREVVVFQSTPAELRRYENGLPFTVIGDPGKELYRMFGVETSARAITKPTSLAGAARRVVARHQNRDHQTARPHSGQSDQRQPRLAGRSVDRRRRTRRRGEVRRTRLRPMVRR